MTRLRHWVFVLAWLAIWQVVAMLVAQPLLLPGPWETLVAWVLLAGTAEFWLSVGASFATIVGAFTGTFLLATLLGGIASSRPWLADFIRPVALVVKATPVACIVVVLLLWLGAQGVPVAAVALVVFPAYYFTTLEGARSVRVEVRDALRVMGVSRGRLWLAHTWPSVLPYLVATSKNAVGMSWKAGVAAELIAMALNTMGEKVYQAKLLLEAADLFAWTATIILLAFVCEKAFLWLLEESGSWSLRRAVRSAPSEPAGVNVGEEPVIVVDDLRVELQGKPIVGPVSFTVNADRPLCLRGESGIGKTTLLGAIMGLVPCTAGTVERPRRLSAVFQEARLVEGLSLEDNVALVACGTPRETVREVLGELLPGVEPTREVSKLSGGERRRVEIVRALLCPGAAVLLDEPFQGLDAEAHERAIAFILGHLGDRCLIVATHDARDARALGAWSLRL